MHTTLINLQQNLIGKSLQSFEIFSTRKFIHLRLLIILKINYEIHGGAAF